MVGAADGYTRHMENDGSTRDQRNPTDALLAVARRFFPEAVEVESLTTDGRLGRVEVGGATWCIRRWPEGMAIERIAFVHEALRVAREADVVVVPEVAVAVEGALVEHPTIIAYESGLFDAQSWMPGREATRIPSVTMGRGEHVNLPVVVPTPVVLESAGLIARVHAATTGVAAGSDRPTMTLRGFGSVSNRAWRSLQHRLDPLAPRLLPVRRWRAAGRKVVRDALAKIEAVGADGEIADVVIHGDLWPAHILTTRRDQALNVTGIIDWTDATAGSPLVDIAHLITHFGGWTPENAESVLAAYHDIRPLRPTERRLLPSVAALDLVAEAGWLLQIGYFDEDELGQGQRSFVRTGADTLIESLETLANVLEFGETSPPRQVRRWVHREPRGGKTARWQGTLRRSRR